VETKRAPRLSRVEEIIFAVIEKRENPIQYLKRDLFDRMETEINCCPRHSNLCSLLLECFNHARSKSVLLILNGTLIARSRTDCFGTRGKRLLY